MGCDVLNMKLGFRSVKAPSKDLDYGMDINSWIGILSYFCNMIGNLLEYWNE